jgi:probable F420-dependent oxidoreductase
MRFSVTMVATGRASGAIAVTELAKAVEERGLDGIWFPDHTHIPIARESRYPLGGELPDRYRKAIDPLAGVAMAAAVTNRIRIGTGVLLVAQRDPIVTAKALATIDDQARGRVVVGIGYGWNTDEMRDHRVDPSTRRRRAREHVLAMRELWEADVASYDGEHVQVSPSWSWPKPAQRPLPVLVGGGPTRTVFAHVAEYAQGWIPVGGHGLAEAVPRLREEVAAAGRDPAALEIIPFLGPGTEQAKVDGLQRAGATEVAFDVLPAEQGTVLGELDRIAAFVAARGR